jgi:hypothetical protein
MARLDRQAWSPHMAIAWEEGGSEQDFPRYRAPLADRGDPHLFGGPAPNDTMRKASERGLIAR